MRVKLMSIMLALLTCIGGCSHETTASNQEEDVTELTFVTFLPPVHSQVPEVLEPLIEEIEAITDGRVKVNLITGDALGSADRMYDMVLTSTVDLSFGMQGYTPGQFPLSELMDLPYMADSAEHATEIMIQLQDEFPEFTEEYDEVGVGWLSSLEPYQIITTDTPVENPDDMKGLRIRSPSTVGNDIIEELGAVPVSMPIGEMYEAMQRNVIDGALSPYSVMKNYQISEVASFVTDLDLSVTSHFLAFNTEEFEQLNENDRRAINSLLNEENAKNSGRVYDQDGAESKDIAIDEGVEIIETSDEENAEWEEIVTPVAENWIEKTEDMGYEAQDIYDRAIEIRDELDEEGDY